MRHLIKNVKTSMQNIIKESSRIREGAMTHEPPKNTITL